MTTQADPKAAKKEREEVRDKGKPERGNREILGRPDDGTSNHPETKVTGYRGDSNAGEDLTSGDG
jgi:hypothetical protein